MTLQDDKNMQKIFVPSDGKCSADQTTEASKPFFVMQNVTGDDKLHMKKTAIKNIHKQKQEWGIHTGTFCDTN